MKTDKTDVAAVIVFLIQYLILSFYVVKDQRSKVRLFFLDSRDSTKGKPLKSTFVYNDWRPNGRKNERTEK